MVDLVEDMVANTLIAIHKDVQSLANGQNGWNGVLVPKHVVVERCSERGIRSLKRNMVDRVKGISARNQLAIVIHALNLVNGVNGVVGKNVQKPAEKE